MTTQAFPTKAQLEAATAYVLDRIQNQPKIGLVLGSGLSPLANEIKEGHTFPYAQIPHFPSSTVQGHSGQLVSGSLAGHAVIVMQGRTHFYEGYTLRQITFPIRVMGLLGIEILIVTNAAGGLNAEFTAGDLMLITDHINMVGMSGHNPLIGPNDPDLGPRFPNMSDAYDRTLRSIAGRVAEQRKISLRHGVYTCLSGPTFETPAEVRFLRQIGSDAVGMSTVHEVIVARHMSVRVLGISGITNIHSTDPAAPTETSHDEVLEASQIIAPRMINLIRGVLEKL